MEGSKKYYSLFGSDTIHGEPAGAVICQSEALGWELFPDEGLIAWPIPDFHQDAGKWPGPLGDYVGNDLGRRLCSTRLRELLERLKADGDVVQWIPARVIDADGVRGEYYFLHFPQPLDVLDRDKSVFDDEAGVLIKPYLSISKIGDHRLFTLAGLEVATIVSESIKQSLQREAIEGVTFSPIPAK